MKFTSTIIYLCLAIGGTWLLYEHQQFTLRGRLNSPLFEDALTSVGDRKNEYAREAWELRRLVDPATGNIPEGMRSRELAFAATLPRAGTRVYSGYKKTAYKWQPRGPFFLGGRTRALAADVENENILIAGGASGGIWRSEDGGTTWSKVTTPGQAQSISTLVQDTRKGETKTWYCGTGEAYGNSAGKSYTADYLGDGVYKSTDGGHSWQQLEFTVSGTPHQLDSWDKIWRVAVDPSSTDKDIVYAAIHGSIQRSDDGGNSWHRVLGEDSYFTDVTVTSTGVVYATLSTTSITGLTARQAGLWRSSNGTDWTRINTGSGWPGNTNRIVPAIDPNNEDVVYFLGNTPGKGAKTESFNDRIEYNSLWKYEYRGGDGSNGLWTNLSGNLPVSGKPIDRYFAQGSYNMLIAVKPGNSNILFIGGTNLYRSSDAFTSDSNTTQIGGYKEGTQLPFYETYPVHHPDQHTLVFLSSNTDVMLCGNDGGVYITEDCTANNVIWKSLNNGYITSQFYTVTVDHGTPGSNIIAGGTQDNGTRWTGSNNPTAPWTHPFAGDGSFCAIEDGGGTYYFSRQRGKIGKVKLDAKGDPISYNRIDPKGAYNFMFINPFILDPMDNNIMYLPEGNRLWRNDSLSSIPLENKYDPISMGWKLLDSVTGAGSADITAIACSRQPANRVYIGTSNGRVMRINNANTGNPASVNISSGLGNGYVSCIAVDPGNADHVLVVFSNYNTYSLFYSKDGGDTWMKVAGNLETGPPEGFPPQYKYIGDGPSTRWASIIPVDDGTVYLLGSSVGLFATDTLIRDQPGVDSTVWVQQGWKTIGNVVVDMMDYRISDGYVAIGTHGNGIYSAHITNRQVITSTREHEVISGARLFPNPSHGQFRVTWNNPSIRKVSLQLFSLGGQMVMNLDEVMRNNTVSTNGLRSGIYIARISSGKEQSIFRIAVQ